MPFTSEELEKIREHLPASLRKELIEKFSIKPGSLRNILSGTAKNDDVLIEAAALVKKHQEKIQTTKNLLASL